MRIQYASDLHLEMSDNENFLWHNPLRPSGDILLLAGDVVTFKKFREHRLFFDYISANFKLTYWVPGNHEYYHSDLSDNCGSFIEPVRENIFLVNDYAVTIENIRFIFSTLWTSIRTRSQIAIEKRMNDFHLIRYKGNRLTCEDLISKHNDSVAFIRNELLNAPLKTKTIVVTHHVPTFRNYPPQYFGDLLNEAFAVELKGLIRECKPDYWIYGHHHQNIPEFTIDDTRLLTNQLGYVRYNENSLFDCGKVIEID